MSIAKIKTPMTIDSAIVIPTTTSALENIIQSIFELVKNNSDTPVEISRLTCRINMVINLIGDENDMIQIMDCLVNILVHRPLIGQYLFFYDISLFSYLLCIIPVSLAEFPADACLRIIVVQN